MTIRPNQIGPAAVAAIVVIAPFDLAVPANGFGPLFIRPLMVAAALLALAAHAFSGSRASHRITLAAVALAAAVWLSTVLAEDRGASAAASIRLTLIVVVFLAASANIRTDTDRQLLVATLAVVTVIASAIGLATHVAGQDLLGTQHLLGSISSSNGVLRLTRPFSQANVGAMFLAPPTAICAIAAARRSNPSKERILLLGASLAGTAALALTYSNGGYIALGAGLVCGATALWRTGESQVLFPLGLAALLVIARLFDPDWQRRTEFDPGPSPGGRPRPLGRTEMWQQAVDAFSEYPLSGLGTGRFGAWSTTRTPEGFVAAPHAHSIPFEVLATTGLAGTVALVGFVGTVAVAPIRSRQMDSALFAGIAAIAVHALVDYGLIFASSGLMIATVAGAFAASANARSDRGR